MHYTNGTLIEQQKLKHEIKKQRQRKEERESAGAHNTHMKIKL